MDVKTCLLELQPDVVAVKLATLVLNGYFAAVITLIKPGGTALSIHVGCMGNKMHAYIRC